MIRDGSVGLVGYNANAKKIKRKSLAGTQFLKSLFWLLKILLFFFFHSSPFHLVQVPIPSSFCVCDKEDRWYDGNIDDFKHWSCTDLQTMTGFSTALAPPHPHPHILSCRAAYPLTQFFSLCSFAFLHSLLLWSYMFRPLSQGYQLVFGSRILGFPWEYSKTRPSGLSFNREAAADGLLLNSSCRNLAELPHVLLRTTWRWTMSWGTQQESWVGRTVDFCIYDSLEYKAHR